MHMCLYCFPDLGFHLWKLYLCRIILICKAVLFPVVSGCVWLRKHRFLSGGTNQPRRTTCGQGVDLPLASCYRHLTQDLDTREFTTMTSEYFAGVKVYQDENLIFCHYYSIHILCPDDDLLTQLHCSSSLPLIILLSKLYSTIREVVSLLTNNGSVYFVAQISRIYRSIVYFLQKNTAACRIMLKYPFPSS